MHALQTFGMIFLVGALLLAMVPESTAWNMYPGTLNWYGAYGGLYYPYTGYYTQNYASYYTNPNRYNMPYGYGSGSYGGYGSYPYYGSGYNAGGYGGYGLGGYGGYGMPYGYGYSSYGSGYGSGSNYNSYGSGVGYGLGSYNYYPQTAHYTTYGSYAQQSYIPSWYYGYNPLAYRYFGFM